MCFQIESKLGYKSETVLPCDKASCRHSPHHLMICCPTGQEGAANITAGVSGGVSCGDVLKCVNSAVGDAVTEEPLYASVNPFAKTGKILDLDSPTDG